MESASIFNKAFDDEDDEEEHGNREGSLLKELTVIVNGRSNEQKASTPRSKHSVTEQRRRSKINDRFQFLKGLLPNSDQKRDKASFLLEVIEYIRFLQEKVNKYESIYPRWSDESTKFMPWSNNTGSGNAMTEHLSLKKSASPLLTSDAIPVRPAVLLSTQKPTESVLIASASCTAPENLSGLVNMVLYGTCSLQPNLLPSLGRGTGVGQQSLIPEDNNMVAQPDWLRTCASDCNVSKNLLDESEELTIDESTISASTAYSQGLLNTLSQALQHSGVDLSQTSISVHINLGRRTSRDRGNASTSMASPKDLDEAMSSQLSMGHARLGRRNDDSEQAAKRHKSDDR